MNLTTREQLFHEYVKAALTGILARRDIWDERYGGDDKSFEMLSAITGMSTDELRAM